MIEAAVNQPIATNLLTCSFIAIAVASAVAIAIVFLTAASETGGTTGFAPTLLTCACLPACVRSQ